MPISMPSRVPGSLPACWLPPATALPLGLLTSITMVPLRDRFTRILCEQVGIATGFAGASLFIATAWRYFLLQDGQVSVWESLPPALGFGTGSGLLLFAPAPAMLKGFLKRQLSAARTRPPPHQKGELVAPRLCAAPSDGSTKRQNL